VPRGRPKVSSSCEICIERRILISRSPSYSAELLGGGDLKKTDNSHLPSATDFGLMRPEGKRGKKGNGGEEIRGVRERLGGSSGIGEGYKGPDFNRLSFSNTGGTKR